MRGVKGVKSAGAGGGGGDGCFGAGLGLGVGFVGREAGWEEEEEDGPEPRTWEVPLKVEGVPDEATFFMKSFILSFIIAAGGGGGRGARVGWVGAGGIGASRQAWKR